MDADITFCQLKIYRNCMNVRTNVSPKRHYFKMSPKFDFGTEQNTTTLFLHICTCCLCIWFVAVVIKGITPFATNFGHFLDPRFDGLSDFVEHVEDSTSIEGQTDDTLWQQHTFFPLISLYTFFIYLRYLFFISILCKFISLFFTLSPYKLLV